ncbi:MAG: MATE family efflux transporter [Gammaproteobacteria bacterium]|jgi:multidrug resistance protein, MATE family|nr:MATE family efflux transporter [Gammaproteobacteria bacterium]
MFDRAVEFKTLLKLALPMMGTQFFIMGMGFMDTAMAGHYSSLDLAGVALGGIVLWPLFMAGSGILMAVTPMTAQLRGEGKQAEVGSLARQGLWLGLIAGIVLCLLLRVTGPVFSLFSVDADAITIAEEYLKAVTWGLPAGMLYVTLRYTSEGLGKTLPPMVIAGTALVVNAILNYVFIYGKLGMPEMGGAGCGWATAATMWFEFFAILILAQQSWFKKAKIFSRFSPPRKPGMSSILSIGAPIGAIMFLEMSFHSLISLMIGSLGIVALAAHTISGHISWAAFVVPMTLGSAASIRVGFYVGARQFEKARAAAWLALQVALVYAVLASVLVLLARHWLPEIYSSDPEVIALAASVLVVVAIFQLFDSAQASLLGTLRGYKDTKIPLVISIVGYWFLALPFAAAIGYGYFGIGEGVVGFWVGLLIGLVLVAVLAAFRLQQTSLDHARIRRFAEI